MMLLQFRSVTWVRSVGRYAEPALGAPLRRAQAHGAARRSRIVTDGYRYRTIGSGQALALAVAAAALTPALVWLVL